MMYPRPVQGAGSGAWGQEISQGNALAGQRILTASGLEGTERGEFKGTVKREQDMNQY